MRANAEWSKLLELTRGDRTPIELFLRSRIGIEDQAVNFFGNDHGAS
jgi:hypothetical protein